MISLFSISTISVALAIQPLVLGRTQVSQQRPVITKKIVTPKVMVPTKLRLFSRPAIRPAGPDYEVEDDSDDEITIQSNPKLRIHNNSVKISIIDRLALIKWLVLAKMQNPKLGKVLLSN